MWSARSYGGYRDEQGIGSSHTQHSALWWAENVQEMLLHSDLLWVRICNSAGYQIGRLSTGILNPGQESLSMRPAVVGWKQYTVGLPFADLQVFCRKREAVWDPQYLTMHLLGLFFSLCHLGNLILPMGLFPFGEERPHLRPCFLKFKDMPFLANVIFLKPVWILLLLCASDVIFLFSPRQPKSY